MTAVVAMTDAIAHRGPDDYGYLCLHSRDGEFQVDQEGLEPSPVKEFLERALRALLRITFTEDDALD